MRKSLTVILLFLALCIATGFTRLAVQEDAPVVAPDFTLPDTAGNAFTLSSMRGKYVVLDFWGTWCKICLKDLPELRSVYERHRGKFEVVGVDCGDRTVKWKHWVDSLGLPWHNVIMGRRLDVQRAYRIKGYPTKVIVAPDGRVVKSFSGRDPRFFLMLEEILDSL